MLNRDTYVPKQELLFLLFVFSKNVNVFRLKLWIGNMSFIASMIVVKGQDLCSQFDIFMENSYP